MAIRKYPKKRSRNSRPFGVPSLLAPIGRCRQAVHGLTATLRTSCAQPYGLFLPPLRDSAELTGPKPLRFDPPPTQLSRLNTPCYKRQNNREEQQCSMEPTCLTGNTVLYGIRLAHCAFLSLMQDKKMSEIGLNLLIESGLLTSSGSVVDTDKLDDKELSKRVSHYINGRIQVAEIEVQEIGVTDRLSALFSTGSTRTTRETMLSNLLVYDSLIIDDPLVTSRDSVHREDIRKTVDLYSWGFILIKSGFLKILPISYFNRPYSEVPLLCSDDQFKSDIPNEIHDFIHRNVRMKSIMRDDKGRMLILNEEASEKRRPSLFIEFNDDYWVGGPNSYLFQTIDSAKRDKEGNMICNMVWNPNENLDKEKFDHWAYQCINQSMRARLINIYNETVLADTIGYTYVTESIFEANILSMSGIKDKAQKCESARFLEANERFVEISTPSQIVELREKHAQAFESFSSSLLSISEELSNTDTDKFNEKSNQLYLNEIMPQIDTIRDCASSVSSSSLKGGFISLCGMGAAILSGSVIPLVPALMLGIASGLSEALPEVSKMQRLKKRPAFIWHKITTK